MTSDHLTDQQLQEYLDGVLEPQQVLGIEKHLRHCDVCQAELQQYQFLYSELQAAPPAILAPDFSVAVIKIIRFEKTKALLTRLWSALWPIGTFAAAVGVMSRYVDLKSFVSLFIESLNPTRYFDSTIIANLYQILEKYHINLNIIIFAGLTLILVFLIDQFISKYRSKIFTDLKILPIL
ncbi:MAG: zf-HC2 domain-containing protein [candidate division KSB1 bacterium]|nr:zf-HC2 domain-containing protein [candidate division KSB1 bacterium]MDZ7333644.1 zf-HC2 domain-containing protein [candidate division KSB1 bacterium]MDZ7358131.1 zf-HC2 domain-containing protein [candidate division KSB1 bacterium]MDZ7398758.1 zf-HC2 domain-containing protein [candidate division KSB1 bacterium]